jgi:hypothetical protein
VPREVGARHGGAVADEAQQLAGSAHGPK